MFTVRLAKETDEVIGWGDQDGELDGTFCSMMNGTVIYRHPVDTREWLAGSTTEQFVQAANAWNAYAERVAGLVELRQREVVAQLRDSLNQIGVLPEGPQTLWSVLYEQAEQGLL